eukprot:UN00429
MLSFIVVGFIGLVSAQYGRPCEYHGGPNGVYLLNLTSVNGYRLEVQSTDGHNYYHTPCWNGEECRQGSANFQGNAVQFTNDGSNQCLHVLSIDHHERPTYFFGGALWAFQYRDGQLCDLTQQPRMTNIYYVCDEFQGTYLAEAWEPEICRYTMNVRSPLACVPVDRHNANCQWSYFDPSSGTTYRLDLSALNGSIVHDSVNNNGYEHYYSPCQNGLHCWQQAGEQTVMSIIENRETHTCERYLSAWQEGRVQPFFHNTDPDNVYWSFHYWLSQTCKSGAQGEETINWFCNPAVANFTVINGSHDGDCHWQLNVASAHACPDSPEYTTLFGQKFDFSKL